MKCLGKDAGCFVRRPRVAIALALRRRQAFGGRWEAQALA